MEQKLNFASDYLEGAHPYILERLMETNMSKETGYGFDSYSESAREKIREAIKAPEADVFFLSGGTQTNATVIDAMLTAYQGVIACDTGHIATHEAGAIEAGGHKVIEVPGTFGKLDADHVVRTAKAFQNDENRDHLVMPGLVYISQPTEYGTLYSLDELEAISGACHENGMRLYLDGARLAYALACPENDVSLPDIARICDAFYIGGTKCGTLLGEAAVFPKHDTVPHFFTLVKRHGALLAKGRAVGVQFETLFTNDLYQKIGVPAIKAADSIRAALIGLGYTLHYDTPTNQIFVELTKEENERLSEKVIMGFWENLDDGKVVMRIATSWATTEGDVDRLIECLKEGH